jgi:hypothetical protein
MLFWMWIRYKIDRTEHMTFVLQGVCMNLNIFVTYVFIKIIIYIVEKDRRWRCCHRKNTINWWNQMVCISSKFDNFHPSYKYDLPTTRLIKKIHLVSSIFIVHGCHFYIFIFELLFRFGISHILICKLIWYFIII